MKQEHEEHELRERLEQAESMLRATRRRQQHPAVIAKIEKIRNFYRDELRALAVERHQPPRI